MSILEYIPDHPLVVPVAVFGFLASLWILVITATSQLTRRGDQAGDRMLRTWIDGKETTVVLPLSQTQRKQGYESFLARAGVRVSGRAFASQSIMMLGFSFVLALLWSRSVLVGIGVLALIATIILSILRYRAARRRDLVAQQCVETLRLANRSLKAGRSVPSMMQLLADNVESPTKEVFVEVIQREKMGEPLPDAIRAAMLRFESPELRAFGTALLLQIEVGGNLMETLDRLSSSIIQRMALRKRGVAMTANARLSSKVILLVPFMLVFFLSVASEHYAEFMFGESLGRLLLVGALLLVLGGFLAVNRITSNGVEKEASLR